MVHRHFPSLILVFVSLVTVTAAPTVTNVTRKPATTEPEKSNPSPGTTVAGRGPIYQQRADNISHLSDVAELYAKVIKINISDKAKPVQVDFTALLGPDEDPMVSEELFHILHAEANDKPCVTQMDEDFQQTKTEAPKISEKLTLEKIQKVGEALLEKMNALKFPSDTNGRQSSSSDLVTAYRNKLKAGFVLENRMLELTALSQKVTDYQLPPSDGLPLTFMSEVNQNTAVISDDVSKKVASATNPALFLRLREILTFMTAFNKYMDLEGRHKNSIGGDLLPMQIFESITKRFGHGFTSKKLYVMTADECSTQNLEICTEVRKGNGSGFWEKKNRELCRAIKSVDGKLGNKLIAMKEILREKEEYQY